MVPSAIVYQVAALVTAAALSVIAVEARWTRRAALRHERQLNGTEYRRGIAELVNNHLRGKNED